MVNTILGFGKEIVLIACGTIAILAFIFAIILAIFLVKAIFYIAILPFSVCARVKEIEKKNEELRKIDEKWNEAKKSGDEKALEEASFEWARETGFIAAATKVNERRLMAANYPFSPPIGSIREPLPGILEDIYCIFMTLKALRKEVVEWIIRRWKLARLEYLIYSWEVDI